jgi:hypothetical protein
MADQETVERTFTSGEIRVLTDVARAVANGTITPAELQKILNERKTTQEKMPAWIRCSLSYASGSEFLEVGIFEKNPGPSSQPIFLTTIEDVEMEHSLRSRWFHIRVYAETELWRVEAKKRLSASPKVNALVWSFRRGENSKWKEYPEEKCS